jgi:hypothetical protein
MKSFLQHIQDNQLLASWHQDYEATSTLVFMILYLNQSADWSACKSFLLEIFKHKDMPRNGVAGPTFAELVGPRPPDGNYQVALLKNPTFANLTTWKSLSQSLGASSDKSSGKPASSESESQPGKKKKMKGWSDHKTAEFSVKCEHHNKFYAASAKHSTDNCQAFINGGTIRPYKA